MNTNEILDKMRQLMDANITPGQAFDVLLELRKAGVRFADVANAVNAKPVDLDHNEEAFQCPNCGIARTLRDRCENPACSDYRSATGAPTAFKNPKVSFGRKHVGKTLLEIGELDPGYLKWMADKHDAPFWREQARLAMIQLSAEAPSYRDTDATGYMDDPAY